MDVYRCRQGKIYQIQAAGIVIGYETKPLRVVALENNNFQYLVDACLEADSTGLSCEMNASCLLYIVRNLGCAP